MKHLSDHAANLQIAEQVARKAEPTWSALKEPHHYVPLRQHTLEGFAERQQQRRRAAGWPEPKGASHA